MERRSGSAGKPKVTGMFAGKEVSFNAVWGKHTFTEDEIARLLAGETIKIDYTSKAGRKKTTTGKLTFNKYDPVARKHVVYKETKLR